MSLPAPDTNRPYQQDHADDHGLQHRAGRIVHDPTCSSHSWRPNLGRSTPHPVRKGRHPRSRESTPTSPICSGNSRPAIWQYELPASTDCPLFSWGPSRPCISRDLLSLALARKCHATRGSWARRHLEGHHQLGGGRAGSPRGGATGITTDEVRGKIESRYNDGSCKSRRADAASGWFRVGGGRLRLRVRRVLADRVWRTRG